MVYLRTEADQAGQVACEKEGSGKEEKSGCATPSPP